MDSSYRVGLMLLAAMIVVSGSCHLAAAAPASFPPHHASARLSAGPLPSSAGPVAVAYDEQIGITFADSFTSMAYNVTAVAQTDSDGYGPAYLLNGLTDQGYWYQVGVNYDWPYQTGGYNAGFHMIYEVFDSGGNSVFPASGGGGSADFSGQVRSGDNVLLNLYLSGGNVVLFVKDWDTGAWASETYTAFGSKFIGLSDSGNSNGFFTGLMTEWYHVNAYYGGEGAVTYSDPYFGLSSGVLWADEYNPSTGAVQFSDARQVYFTDPNLVQTFSSNGAEDSANAYMFMTGAPDKTLLTFSYSVPAAAVGYSPPVLTYVYDGSTYTAAMSTTPTTYFADIDSHWSVSGVLPGNSSEERLATGQTISGAAASSTTEIFGYVVQYHRLFDYAVVGSGGAAPTVKVTEFGQQEEVVAGTWAWVDAGSVFEYPSTLPGSGSAELWITDMTSGVAGSPGTTTATYYHEFEVAITVHGSSLPQGLMVNGTKMGGPLSVAMSNGTITVDAGTRWSVTGIYSEQGQRWVCDQPVNGTVSGPLSLVFTYVTQYMVAVHSNAADGGSVGISGGWVAAGSNITLSQTAAPGWEFEGWSGAGSGSYTGILATQTITVRGPLDENATFYPGLTITVSSDGTVSYKAGNVSGIVAAGSKTVYVPAGTQVQLQASPSALYSFDGWAGSVAGGAPTSDVSVSAPLTAQASFGLDYGLVGGVGVAAAAVIAAAVFVVIRRR